MLGFESGLQGVIDKAAVDIPVDNAMVLGPLKFILTVIDIMQSWLMIWITYSMVFSLDVNDSPFLRRNGALDGIPYNQGIPVCTDTIGRFRECLRAFYMTGVCALPLSTVSLFRFCIRQTQWLCACLLIVNQGVFAAEDTANDSRPTMTFACEARPEQPNYSIVKKYLTHIFDQLGYRYIQQYANIDETIFLLKSGQVDGDCGRLDGFVERSGLHNYTPIGPAYIQVVFSRWYVNPPLRPRQEQRVGYNENALVLKGHLMKMGYKNLYPIDTTEGSIERLRSGEWDLVVNYDRAMASIDSSSDHQDIKRSDSFVTLPARPYVTKAMAQKLEENWGKAAKDFFTQRTSVKTEIEIPRMGADKIIFACSVHQKSSVFNLLERRYSRLFAQLGYDYQQISMPRGRETHELSSGNIDGTCGRTYQHAFNQPNTVRVDHIIATSSIRVWSLSAADDIRSVEDLVAGRRIAYTRGTTSLDQMLERYRGSVAPITDLMTGIKMLAAGRIDYLIGIDNIYQSLITDTVFQTPIYGVGNLGLIEVYPYLHRSRSAVAEKLKALLTVESQKK